MNEQVQSSLWFCFKSFVTINKLFSTPLRKLKKISKIFTLPKFSKIWKIEFLDKEHLRTNLSWLQLEVRLIWMALVRSTWQQQHDQWANQQRLQPCKMEIMSSSTGDNQTKASIRNKLKSRFCTARASGTERANYLDF